MIPTRIRHKGTCQHPQTSYARRKCRATLLAAARTEQEKTMSSRYQVQPGPRPGVWCVTDTHTGEVVMRERDKEMIERYAAARNTTQQTTTALPSIAPAATTPTPTPRTGWSKASQRHTRRPVDTVGQMLGRAKSGPYTDCHYCGLDPRTCDCN